MLYLGRVLAKVRYGKIKAVFPSVFWLRSSKIVAIELPTVRGFHHYRLAQLMDTSMSANLMAY